MKPLSKLLLGLLVLAGSVLAVAYAYRGSPPLVGFWDAAQRCWGDKTQDSARTANNNGAESDVEGVKTAAVSMSAALEIALKQAPGTASMAEFFPADVDGPAEWQIEIISDAGTTDVDVDANSGKVIPQADEAQNDQDAAPNGSVDSSGKATATGQGEAK